MMPNSGHRFGLDHVQRGDSAESSPGQWVDQAGKAPDPKVSGQMGWRRVSDPSQPSAPSGAAPVTPPRTTWQEIKWGIGIVVALSAGVKFLTVVLFISCGSDVAISALRELFPQQNVDVVSTIELPLQVSQSGKGCEAQLETSSEYVTARYFIPHHGPEEKKNVKVVITSVERRPK
jgi:hypothetical protein